MEFPEFIGWAGELAGAEFAMFAAGFVPGRAGVTLAERLATKAGGCVTGNWNWLCPPAGGDVAPKFWFTSCWLMGCSCRGAAGLSGATAVEFVLGVDPVEGDNGFRPPGAAIVLSGSTGLEGLPEMLAIGEPPAGAEEPVLPLDQGGAALEDALFPVGRLKANDPPAVEGGVAAEPLLFPGWLGVGNPKPLSAF
jgi:hypothetical protein